MGGGGLTEQERGVEMLSVLASFTVLAKTHPKGGPRPLKALGMAASGPQGLINFVAFVSPSSSYSIFGLIKCSGVTITNLLAQGTTRNGCKMLGKGPEKVRGTTPNHLDCCFVCAS